jgi:trk system potassium uptake protein TrkH
MLLLCCFCASSGSTGGGVKMIRAQLLFKQVFREMIVIMHPQAVSPVKVSNSVVPNRIVYAVLAFLSIYLASIVSMTLILTFSGLDFITAFSTVVYRNFQPIIHRILPNAARLICLIEVSHQNMATTFKKSKEQEWTIQMI